MKLPELPWWRTDSYTLAGHNDGPDMDNPDLPPVIVNKEDLARWRDELPELPAARHARFMAGHGLSLRAPCRSALQGRPDQAWAQPR